MAFEKLSEGLRGAVDSIREAVVLDKKKVKEYVKEIQKTLLAADVNVDLVLELTERIEQRGLEEEPPGSLTRKENIIRITYEELVDLLGEGGEIDFKEGHKILLVVTQGSGKTTTVAKLGRFLKKKGLNPNIICADTFRPAAYEQLKQLAGEINVPYHGNPEQENSLEIIEQGLEEFEKGTYIIDSEGRHKLDEKLMEDIKEISSEINPERTLLVLDATMGQEAGKQAQAFEEACGIDGVILTKMDGTAKGGGALSACSQTKAKVYFLGVGEHLQDLEKFDPERFVSRLIGFGDLEGLLEKAKEVEIDEEVAQRMMSGKFNLEDLYQQIEQMHKMGPLDKIIDMIPFGGKIPDDMLEMQEEKLDKFEIAMDSMTQEEMENPEMLKSSRVERIAQGSGVSEEEVRELLKYYKKMKKLTKMMGDERKMKRVMKKMKGGFMGG